MDPKIHQEYIGADNQLILENLESLIKRKKEVILRTPIIPGFNDKAAQIGAIARYAANLGIQEMHLLHYHSFGEGKYRLLARCYPFQGRKKLGEEEIDKLKDSVGAEGLQIKVGG
jgi:pyruvate formate lyase activating enzyme